MFFHSSRNFRNSFRNPFFRFTSKFNYSTSRLISSSTRYFRRNPQSVIYTIMGINTAIFGSWIYAESFYKSFKDPTTLNFMQKHFTLGLGSPLLNYVTHCFSHSSLIHFGINMFVLHSFGSMMISILGIGSFLRLYAISGLTAGITSMIHKQTEFEQTGRPPPPSIGASGCISGVLTTYALMYPFATIQFFIIPMPAIVGIGGIFLYDLYKATRSSQGRTDSAGHVGGGLGALIYYFFVIRR